MDGIVIQQKQDDLLSGKQNGNNLFYKENH